MLKGQTSPDWSCLRKPRDKTCIFVYVCIFLSFSNKKTWECNMNVHDITLEWLLWSSWLDRSFIPGVALIASEKMSGLQNSSASSWMMMMMMMMMMDMKMKKKMMMMVIPIHKGQYILHQKQTSTIISSTQMCPGKCPKWIYQVICLLDSFLIPLVSPYLILTWYNRSFLILINGDCSYLILNNPY